MYTAGQGTSLLRGIASGASLPAPGSDSFLPVNLISGLKLPSDVRTINTFKTLDSVVARKIGGGFEDQAVSFRLVLDTADAVHLSMATDAVTATSTTARRNWRVILPDTGAYQYDFVGFINKWEPEDIENEKEIAVAVEIALDGTMTRTP